MVNHGLGYSHCCTILLQSLWLTLQSLQHFPLQMPLNELVDSMLAVLVW